MCTGCLHCVSMSVKCVYVCVYNDVLCAYTVVVCEDKRRCGVRGGRVDE